MNRQAVIVDVDGTLVDVSSVRHYVAGIPFDKTQKNYKKDFDKFHSEAVNCPPIEWVVKAVKDCHRQGFDILIVTARGSKFRNQTAFWLAMNDIPSHAMFMRRQGDFRKDYIVKSEILSQIRAAGWNPVLAIDDNPHVIALWEENHIPTITVPGYSE